MFSGIVEESAQVVSIEKTKEPVRLVVKSGLDHAATKLGDSICISGVCLTVVARDGGTLSFDLAQETLRRSTLGSLKNGDRVNLERSLQLGDRLHGHFVFGHVDATAELVSRTNDGKCDRLEWKFPPELRPYFASKGSVSISGVSLTLGEVTDTTFSVYIIPHTSDITILSSIPVGGKANLEIDMLSRYVHESLTHRAPAGTKSSLSVDFLQQHGFADGK
ncbi:MAG: riboflavin synthase [Deltaproteobacteria bacterium]|nr:riboflavin synthase [Deltaproteobacteria bacterium]